MEVVDGSERIDLFSRMGYFAIRAGIPQGQTMKTAANRIVAEMHQCPTG